MKLKDILIILVVIAVLVVGCSYAIYSIKQESVSFKGSDIPTNDIGSIISYSTTTSVTGAGYCEGCPVKLLDKSNGRRYVHIHNNSDTDIYLFATTTALDLTGTGAARAATTSIATLNGIRIAANDGDNTDDDYIIDSDNLIYGHLWASTTADGVAKEILVNYYQ